VHASVTCLCEGHAFHGWWSGCRPSDMHASRTGRLVACPRHAPGSLPGFRSGTNAQCSASASGAPQMKPRASKPASTGCICVSVSACVKCVSECVCVCVCVCVCACLICDGVSVHRCAALSRQGGPDCPCNGERTDHCLNALPFVTVNEVVDRVLESLRAAHGAQCLPWGRCTVCAIARAACTVRTW